MSDDGIRVVGLYAFSVFVLWAATKNWRVRRASKRAEREKAERDRRFAEIDASLESEKKLGGYTDDEWKAELKRRHDAQEARFRDSSSLPEQPKPSGRDRPLPSGPGAAPGPDHF